jgi:hypothetical protein
MDADSVDSHETVIGTVVAVGIGRPTFDVAGNASGFSI